MYNEIHINDKIRLLLPDTPIGVNFSGGCDSTMLTYLLMRHARSKLHIFTFAAVDKGARNPENTAAILHALVHKTNNVNIEQHNSYYQSLAYDVYKVVPEQYQAMGVITDRFTAVTANPPAEIAFSFSEHADSNAHHAARDPLQYREDFYLPSKWHTPFTNIDKKVIARMYKEFDLMDVFPLTRSCESRDLSFGTTNCGECWWCKERLWAFGRLH